MKRKSEIIKVDSQTSNLFNLLKDILLIIFDFSFYRDIKTFRSCRRVCKFFLEIIQLLKISTIVTFEKIENIAETKFLFFSKSTWVDISFSWPNSFDYIDIDYIYFYIKQIKDKKIFQQVECVRFVNFLNSKQVFKMLELFPNVKELTLQFDHPHNIHRFDWKKFNKCPTLLILYVFASDLKRDNKFPTCLMDLSKTNIIKLYIEAEIDDNSFYLKLSDKQIHFYSKYSISYISGNCLLETFCISERRSPYHQKDYVFSFSSDSLKELQLGSFLSIGKFKPPSGLKILHVNWSCKSEEKSTTEKRQQILDGFDHLYWIQNNELILQNIKTLHTIEICVDSNRPEEYLDLKDICVFPFVTTLILNLHKKKFVRLNRNHFPKCHFLDIHIYRESRVMDIDTFEDSTVFYSIR